MNMGVFAVVNIIEKEERGHLSVSDYAGMGFKYPLLGICLTVFMLSLAGIPPTAGFLGKFYLFAAAFKEGFLWLALFGLINSVIAIYYYLRILVYLYMKDSTEKVIPHKAPLSYAVIAVTAVLSLVFGIASTALYSPAVKSILDLLASN
jgi:NADH-quinone oxidoreductase subunit N